MKRRLATWIGSGVVGIGCLWVVVGAALAQLPISTESSALPPRKLAEGILTVVAPNPRPEDTSVGPIELDFVQKHPELNWLAPDFPENAPFFNSPTQTLLALGRDVHLRHTVFALEFAFKPMRLLQVDLGGERKLVWYLLYRVRYLGNDLTPNVKAVEAGTGVPQEPKRTVSQSALFVPKFRLVTGPERHTYEEKILPAAKRAIAARERVGQPLYDSFEMIRKIPRSTDTESSEFWGVATWTNVDPNTDFLAVHVEGLTNAYRITMDGEKKVLQKKVLQINFWRPGDSIAAAEDLIRLGVPAFQDPARVQYAMEQLGLQERLDYFWTYR
jgi:hypothetical protein